MDAKQGRQELRARGYSAIEATEGDRTVWWNAAEKSCIHLAIKGGRIDGVELRDASECRTEQRQTQRRDGHVDMSALVGARGSAIDSEMAQKNFTNTGGYQADGAAHSLWYNAAAQQCVEVVTRDGRVASVEDIFVGNWTPRRTR